MVKSKRLISVAIILSLVNFLLGAFVIFLHLSKTITVTDTLLVAKKNINVILELITIFGLSSIPFFCYFRLPLAKRQQVSWKKLTGFTISIFVIVTLYSLFTSTAILIAPEAMWVQVNKTVHLFFLTIGASFAGLLFLTIYDLHQLFTNNNQEKAGAKATDEAKAELYKEILGDLKKQDVEEGQDQTPQKDD